MFLTVKAYVRQPCLTTRALWNYNSVKDGVALARIRFKSFSDLLDGLVSSGLMILKWWCCWCLNKRSFFTWNVVDLCFWIICCKHWAQQSYWHLCLILFTWELLIQVYLIPSEVDTLCNVYTNILEHGAPLWLVPALEFVNWVIPPAEPECPISLMAV